jgi:hypothetical protein
MREEIKKLLDLINADKYLRYILKLVKEMIAKMHT